MIGLYTRIGAALVVAAVLAAGGWKAYSAGKDTVQAEWNAEKLDQSEALRRDEKARTIANQKVDNDYQVEKKRRAADAVVNCISRV